ncbi:branched-chain amino acid aminotransferase [Tricharina praecox]|uniref:branched-chain amino acid aminotransferase n=1 Tax=Tricharina praecox TaxID=43433 RepID=UPI00221FA97F|nr:branched-chain amino acid aminotransferase [Tricharina praecox]KAI5857776.1 branched-chain amino acid aminotransferase [Tricharina praecox]
MVFPPPPTSAIDWNDLGFKVREVNGHVSSTYNKTTGQWSAPVFIRDPYLRLHGMSPALNYGQQCYEGLKALRNPDDKSIHIFRPSENARRMQHSASFVAMPPVPEALFLESVHMAVARNAEFVPPSASGASMYIRPLLFGSSAQLGLSPPEEYTFVVYVLPVGVYHGIHTVDCLVLEDFDRAAPAGTGSAKIGGNYAPVLIHSEAARQAGYGITLHLDSKTRTHIDEFSTSGFLAIQYPPAGSGAEVKTKLLVADSNSVIKSITSRSVQQIAKDMGWEVEVRPIRFEECEGFDEVMAAGTAAALVPIKSITKKSTDTKIVYKYGDENPEGVMKLLAALKGIQAGTCEDTHSWREEVKEPAPLIETEANTPSNLTAVNAL